MIVPGRNLQAFTRVSEEAGTATPPLERCFGIPVPKALEEDGPVRQAGASVADQHREASALRDRRAYPH